MIIRGSRVTVEEKEFPRFIWVVFTMILDGLMIWSVEGCYIVNSAFNEDLEYELADSRYGENQ